jgi:hypothetical protein
VYVLFSCVSVLVMGVFAARCEYCYVCDVDVWNCVVEGKKSLAYNGEVILVISIFSRDD